MNVYAPHRRRLGLTILTGISCALAACHAPPRTADPTPAESELAASPELTVIPAAAPGLAIDRALHRSDITEVMLDPTASAALSLDRDGGVRLWTSLSGASVPLALPLHEPRDLSLAMAKDGSFVVAALDTVGGAEVMSVYERDGQPWLESLFSIPPMDPLFELHVLDGGERLLALGVDHRVRLYDRHGNELSSISEHGFVPWQLRHVQTKAGVELVAVLAGPTRVQPLRLIDDQLQITGEAREVELDRGPNRNDLALSADGQHVAALRRPKRRGTEWVLALINLADGSEVLFEGESAPMQRPRLHMLDGDRALLDDGTGVGQMISLAADLAADPAADPAAKEPPQLRPLPGSTPRTCLHASVERGVRVVPSGDHFVVDPLDSDDHRSLGRAPLHVTAAGLSPDGARVLWALGADWVIEDIQSAAGLDAPKPSIRARPDGAPVLLADFVDDQRVLLATSAGPIELRDASSGQALATATPLEHVTNALLSFAPDGAPLLLVYDTWSSTFVALGVEEQQLVELDRIERIESDADYGLGPWERFGDRVWINARVGEPSWGGDASERSLQENLHLALEDVHTPLDILASARGPNGRRYFTVWADDTPRLVRSRPSDADSIGKIERARALDLSTGIFRHLAPSPDGSRLAVVGNDAGRSLSVYDAASLERLWTRVDSPAQSLRWSQDGESLAVGAGAAGGYVVDAVSGGDLLVRRDLGLEVQ